MPLSLDPLKDLKYALVWLLVDDFRAGCDYVFECVFGNYVRNERCVLKKCITLTWVCMCVPWVCHGLKPGDLHVIMLYFMNMNMLKTWCSYKVMVVDWISLKILQKSTQKSEKMDWKRPSWKLVVSAKNWINNYV